MRQIHAHHPHLFVHVQIQLFCSCSDLVVLSSCSFYVLAPSIQLFVHVQIQFFVLVQLQLLCSCPGLCLSKIIDKHNHKDATLQETFGKH